MFEELKDFVKKHRQQLVSPPFNSQENVKVE